MMTKTQQSISKTDASNTKEDIDVMQLLNVLKANKDASLYLQAKKSKTS